MPYSKIIRFFCVIFFCVNLTFAQNYNTKNYTSATALPNNTVRSLFVDGESILWIGTDNGVVRKENDVFTSFFEEDGLALNNCWAIAKDESDKMWFGSYGGGISVYDGNNFNIISKKDGLIHDEITKLFSNNKFMYVGTSDGISIVDEDSLKITSLKPIDNNLFRVQKFFNYQNQIYCVTYNSGVYEIIKEGENFKLDKINSHKFIYNVFIDKDSVYSSNKDFFTKSSVNSYLKKGDSVSLDKNGFSIIWDYVKTSNKNLFAASWGLYSNNGGIYEIVNKQLLSKSLDFNIKSKQLLVLAFDSKFNRLYIGSEDAGLFEVDLKSNIKYSPLEGGPVIGFSKTKNSTAKLLKNSIEISFGDDRKIISLKMLKKWELDYLKNAKNYLLKHTNNFYELNFETPFSEIKFYDIKVNSNSYWVNTNIGIFSIKESGDLDRYLPVHTEELNFTSNGNLIETNPYGGVRVYNDLDNFKYKYFSPESSITPTMVVNSFRKRNKTYFLSVFSGLYVWENNKFSSFLKDSIWIEKKLNHMTSLGGNLAISNEFGDVFIVNDDEKFQLLEKIPRAKIKGNTISFLKEYNGALLIGTEKGCTIYKDHRFIFLNNEQGLQQPFLSADIFENKLLIGGLNGIYSVDLEEVIKPKKLINRIRIKELLINNKLVPITEKEFEKGIDLAFNENTILIKFITNSHPFPNKLVFQYRLNSKEDWSVSSSNTEIFSPYLLDNTYDVQVRVFDESTGLYYSQDLLRLKIHPVFWKSWWFIVLSIFSSLIIIYVIYRFEIERNREFEKQNRELQKRFEETKMEALLAQMNPHFIFNAMNSIQNYIMDSDIDNATLFLGDFSKLIRLNLDHCTRPFVCLVEELEYLQSYIRVENTRFSNRINVSFEVDEALDIYEVEIPSMILQPFIENVFVHAFPPSVENPTLLVSFKEIENNGFMCVVKDNGVGFSKDSNNKLHKSKGVLLVKERLKLLGYNIETVFNMKSSNFNGTSVVIKFQL